MKITVNLLDLFDARCIIFQYMKQRRLGNVARFIEVQFPDSTDKFLFGFDGEKMMAYISEGEAVAGKTLLDQYNIPYTC